MPVDHAGALNPYTQGAIPRFRGDMSQTFGHDDWELTIQTLFISSGVQDVTYNQPGGQTINDNTVPATWYFNLFGRVFAGENKKFEFFWPVNNLLNQDPRITPYNVLNTPVNGQYYAKCAPPTTNNPPHLNKFAPRLRNARPRIMHTSHSLFSRSLTNALRA